MAENEIELEIGGGAGGDQYLVRVVHASGGGEPTGSLHLEVDDLISRLGQLEDSVLASAARARRLAAEEEPLRRIGQQLFEALFTGPVAGAYRASLAVARERGKRLRVVLRLTAPNLAALPWEALWDPELEAFVCRREPLVRHIPAPYTPDPLPVSPPLRILGLMAAPRGLPALDEDGERRRLEDAVAGPTRAGHIQVEWLTQASWGSVHDLLLTGQWHIVHFIGHGDYDAAGDEGQVALVGEDGRADWIGAGRLADLLDQADPTPRLVVLNSCSSAESGTRDLFSGTAATLVRSGISAVAAMQFSVSDRAAVIFPHGFYTSLAAGRGVDEAVQSGRIAILGVPHSLEWVTPVLYVRGASTQLFTVTRTVAAQAEEEWKPSSDEQPHVEPVPIAPRSRPGDSTEEDLQGAERIEAKSAPLSSSRPRIRSLVRRRRIAFITGALLLIAALVTSILSLLSTPTTSTPKVGQAIPVGREPSGIAITPDGVTAYVTNSGDGTVTPIKLANDAPGTPIPVGLSPVGIAISPNGKFAYVADFGDGTVTPINLANDAPEPPIPVGPSPQDIAITPDGQMAYVTHFTDPGTVTPLVLASAAVGAPVAVGSRPAGIAIDPDGHTAYIANYDSNTVTPIAIASNLPGRPIPVGEHPASLAITRAGLMAYVANYGSGTVTPVRLADGTPGVPIPAGLHLQDIAISPDGSVAYVTHFIGGNSVTPIKLATGKLLRPIVVGSNPASIAIHGAGAYVVNHLDNSVTPIRL